MHLDIVLISEKFLPVATSVLLPTLIQGISTLELSAIAIVIIAMVFLGKKILLSLRERNCFKKC